MQRLAFTVVAFMSAALRVTRDLSDVNANMHCCSLSKTVARPLHFPAFKDDRAVFFLADPLMHPLGLSVGACVSVE